MKNAINAKMIYTQIIAPQHQTLSWLGTLNVGIQRDDKFCWSESRREK